MKTFLQHHSVLLRGAALLVLASVASCPNASAQFAGFASRGLVGVGRVSADAFDALGPQVDSLGGIGSSTFIDPDTLARVGDPLNGYTYSGTLYAVPDRGFDGANRDYHPRLQAFRFSITPYYGVEPTNQAQIRLENTGTTLFTYGGTNFTGFEANNTNATSWPQSPPNSAGQGRRSLDPEGLTRAPDGTWYVSDEYGPAILHFDARGELIDRLLAPDACIPRRGSYPATPFFGNGAITTGRIRNRGFEGLTITPDGRRLVAALQSPLLQDGAGNAAARNTRLLFFDVENGSPTHGRLVAEYVYPLTLNGNAATNRQTLISEILALNNETFLVMERDALGLGDPAAASPIYKAVVVASIRGATNIANTGYDLERGAPGALSLPASTPPPGIAPVARFDLVQLVNNHELARFGLNLNAAKDTNTLSEKWEGLGLVPVADPAAPDDFLLLVFNDNDFASSRAYQNGMLVGTNVPAIDSMVLAHRVTLPGVGSPAPANTGPGVTLAGPANPTLSAPATVNLTATAYDQDGIVTVVEFFEDGVKVGEDTTFPFELSRAGVAAGDHSYTARATDNSGAQSASSPLLVVVTTDNLPPAVTLAGPSNPTLSAPATFNLAAVADDPDGAVTRVEFFEDTTPLGVRTSAPYLINLTGVAAGLHTYTAVAVDNQGARTTSATFQVQVTADNLPPEVSLLTPTNGFTASQPATVAFTASALDRDGSVARVEYFRGGTRLGQAATAPYLLTVSNFTAGTHEIRAVAFDNQGASGASTPAVITIRDTIPPVIRCSTNRVVACTDSAGTPVTFAVTATDNNDAAVTVVCTPPSGSGFAPGTNVVNCTATDAAGNQAACSFLVIVLPSPVTIERAVIVRWNCGEVLQGADAPGGPWVDLPGASSPYAVPAAQAHRFYRVRSQP